MTQNKNSVETPVVADEETTRPTRFARIKNIATNPMIMIPAVAITGAVIVLIKTSGKSMEQLSEDI